MLKTKLTSAGLIIGSLVLMSLTTINESNNKNLTGSYFPAFQMVTDILDTAGLKMDTAVADKDVLEVAPEIPLNTNARIFVNAYIRKNGYFLGKTLRRNTASIKLMDAVFSEKQMPLELKYLAFIESGLQRNAGSWAGAVGPWALMPVAAKEYGLKITGHTDERLDFTKSTRAAAALLDDLYAKYGDWLLVIAAYNCGPGWINKAIKKSGSRHYWTLQSFLPEETKKHVKKFIAVHYYFEGKGSIATLTKAEAELHLKTVEEFTAQQTVIADSAQVEVMR